MTVFGSNKEYVDQIFDDLEFESGELSGTLFTDVRFRGCSFSETAFRDCRFNNCLFDDCELSLLKVEGSHFRDVRFDRCRLLGVDWTAAAWPRLHLAAPISFRECVTDYSTFIGLALPKISFRDCRATDVAFSDSDLTEADFRGAILTKSRFDGANLTRANLEGATEYTIDLTSTNIRQARFSFPEAISLLYSLDIVLVD